MLRRNKARAGYLQTGPTVPTGESDSQVAWQQHMSASCGASEQGGGQEPCRPKRTFVAPEQIGDMTDSPPAPCTQQRAKAYPPGFPAQFVELHK